jgi:hypothetical protein
MAAAESGTVTHGGTTVAYVVVRSRRRRRTMQITHHPEHGVRVAVPARTAQWVVREFVEKRARWIVRTAAEATVRPAPLRFVTGETLLYLGEPLSIVDSERWTVDRRARQAALALEGGVLRIAVPGGLDEAMRREVVQRAVVGWYRERAQEHLATRAAFWGERVGYSSPRVLAREQRTRWGSCSADGTLRFNWRLIMAPPDLIDYVVVHELTHIRLRNHSAAFWRELARTIPGHLPLRARLREFGRQLAL